MVVDLDTLQEVVRGWVGKDGAGREGRCREGGCGEGGKVRGGKVWGGREGGCLNRTLDDTTHRSSASGTLGVRTTRAPGLGREYGGRVWYKWTRGGLEVASLGGTGSSDVTESGVDSRTVSRP